MPANMTNNLYYTANSRISQKAAAYVSQDKSYLFKCVSA